MLLANFRLLLRYFPRQSYEEISKAPIYLLHLLLGNTIPFLVRFSLEIYNG